MSSPARLWKQQEESQSSFVSNVDEKLEAWVISHAALCLFVAFAFLIALLTVLMFAICGVSATESGVQYNHLQDVI